MVRGRIDEGLAGGTLKPFLAGRLGVAAALVRMNAEGLKKALVKLVSLVVPFVRFENNTGSMFSRSSTSNASEAFRLTDELEIALAC